MQRKIAIIGCQYGDEGKGKIASYIVKKAVQKNISSIPIIVQRWHGGSNAGHTVYSDGEMYKLHVLPCGVLTPGVFNLIGQGVFLNPRLCMKEIKIFQNKGKHLTPQNLGIAANLHVTLDYHVVDDQAAFNKERHTSTGNGIKQTAVDKFGRVGIRFVEFLDKKVFSKALKKRLPRRDVQSIVESYEKERIFLQPFIVQEHEVLEKHKENFWIGEGAQGVLLDVDVGMYPGVTSSNPSVVPNRPDTILGVIKLYYSSAGSGDRPFVSRMSEQLEKELIEAWGEKGTTTGKNREVGWFDGIATKFAIQSSNVDKLVGTCGDRLEYFYKKNENIKLVVAYSINGKTYTSWDPSFFNRETLHHAIPIVEEFEPWEHFVVNGRLSPNAEKYVKRVEELLGLTFSLLGIGPKEEDILIVEPVL